MGESLPNAPASDKAPPCPKIGPCVRNSRAHAQRGLPRADASIPVPGGVPDPRTELLCGRKFAPASRRWGGTSPWAEWVPKSREREGRDSCFAPEFARLRRPPAGSRLTSEKTKEPHGHRLGRH